ncbi:hypothetical protein OROGR_017414 [Orobanche gracilis]
MEKIGMIALVIAASIMVFVAPHAEGLTCSTVVKNLLPCRTYLRNGGNVPASCCSGARSLHSAANTSYDRQLACRCMKVAARAYRVKPQYAAAVPSKCSVNIGYAVDFNTNCNNVR